MRSHRIKAVTLALFLTATSVLLAGGTKVIFDSDASSYVGQVVSVRGVVSGVYVSKTNTTFVNFGRPYPNHTFTAVIFSSASSRFKHSQQWEGKTITVTGKIKIYKGKPEMVLDSPSQVSE